MASWAALSSLTFIDSGHYMYVRQKEGLGLERRKESCGCGRSRHVVGSGWLLSLSLSLSLLSPHYAPSPLQYVYFPGVILVFSTVRVLKTHPCTGSDFRSS